MPERKGKEETPNEMLKLFVECVSLPFGVIMKEAEMGAGLPALSALTGLAWEGAIAFGPATIATHTERACMAMSMSSRAWEFLAAPIKKALPANLNQEGLFPADGECYRYSIPRGFSVQERIDAMTTLMSGYIREDMVHPRLRGRAEALIRAFQVDGRETLLIAALFQRYIQTEFTYVKDPLYRERLKAPHQLIDSLCEDCDGLTCLHLTLEASVGISGAIVLVSTRPDRIPNHVMSGVYLPDGRLIPIEVTLPKPPGWVVPTATAIRVVPIRYLA